MTRTGTMGTPSRDVKAGTGTVARPGRRFSPQEERQRDSERSSVSKVRVRQLADAGHTKADVAREAEVSWRMVLYWYRAEKPSQKVADAHQRLTGHAPPAVSFQVPPPRPRRRAS